MTDPRIVKGVPVRAVEPPSYPPYPTNARQDGPYFRNPRVPFRTWRMPGDTRRPEPSTVLFGYVASVETEQTGGVTVGH